MNQKMEKEEVKEFLDKVGVMSIAVVLDGKPISSVVTFAVDNDLSFYFLTKRTTYKALALNSNHNISISIWKQNDKLVQASGEVTEIDTNEFENYFNKLSQVSKSAGNAYWPFSVIKGSEHVIYKVTTKWLRIMDLSNQGVGNPYHEIDLGGE